MAPTLRSRSIKTIQNRSLITKNKDLLLLEEKLICTPSKSSKKFGQTADRRFSNKDVKSISRVCELENDVETMTEITDRTSRLKIASGPRRHGSVSNNHEEEKIIGTPKTPKKRNCETPLKSAAKSPKGINCKIASRDHEIENDDNTLKSIDNVIKVTSPCGDTSAKRKIDFNENEDEDNFENIDLLDKEEIGERLNSLDKEKKFVFSTLSRWYNPSTLPGREGHLEQLRNYLRVCKDNGESVSVYMFGSYGHGKTECLNLLSAENFTKENFDYIYINCKSLFSPICIYDEVIEKLNSSKKVLKRDPVNKIKQIIDDRKKPVLLVLDEIDELVSNSDSIVTSLFELRKIVERGKLVLIGVGNTQDFIDRLPAVKDNDQIRPLLMEFESYSKDDLKRILLSRLNLIHLKYLIIEDTVINLISAKLASTGCARDIFGVARRTIEYAIKNNFKDGMCKVQVEHVHDVLDSNNNTLKALDWLSVPCCLVVCSAAILLKTKICTPSTLTFSNVFQYMKKIASDCEMKRDGFYSHCKALESEGLVKIKKTPKTSHFCVTDRLELKYDENEIIRVLKRKNYFSLIIAEYVE